ncbi:hypothetical protein [Rhizobium sp. SL86]|uniref:hypothetical protein n=1 Tax=Rhizobium sp. SL86 TaxID=2995148 RepID=UPI002275CF05|nr:hypothetical protein [Rhizobium sp. SL86]MCY1664588.1 hypothetical protein [Rhizobium sp. SL86]
MEVRLSVFAEIVGTTTATIRNAIQLNKLPFLDTHSQSESTKEGTVSRRLYSVSDAFGWFLQDTLGMVLPMGQWAIAGALQTSYRHGLRHYINDRLASAETSDFYLVLAKGLPKASGLIGGVPEWSFSTWVCSSEAVADYRKNYPVVTEIHLEPLFSLFVETLRLRGWSIDADGFRKISDGEA